MTENTAWHLPRHLSSLDRVKRKTEVQSRSTNSYLVFKEGTT